MKIVAGDGDDDDDDDDDNRDGDGNDDDDDDDDNDNDDQRQRLYLTGVASCAFLVSSDSMTMMTMMTMMMMILMMMMMMKTGSVRCKLRLPCQLGLNPLPQPNHMFTTSSNLVYGGCF